MNNDIRFALQPHFRFIHLEHEELSEKARRHAEFYSHAPAEKRDAAFRRYMAAGDEMKGASRACEVAHFYTTRLLEGRS